MSQYKALKEKIKALSIFVIKENISSELNQESDVYLFVVTLFGIT